MEGILLSAFLAAIASAGNDTSLKYLLGKLKLPLKYYLPYVFVLLTIISAFFLRFDASIKPGAFSAQYIILFVLMVSAAAIWNVLVAESLQTEPLCEYELIILTAPLITIVLAAIFLPAERNIHIFFAGIVASLALVATKIRRHHLQLTKSAKRTLWAVLFIAIETILLRKLLVVYSPMILYFARVLVVAIIFLFIYKPNTNVLKYRDAMRWLVIASLLGATMMVLKYYALRTIGVSETTIILLLGPVLTYLPSYFYFHERRGYKRDLIGALVIVGCIVYSVTVK
ncbi:hypothetical protein COT78_00600 [Candidatus Berkelbacteria bacterium CG10_big_fil_rev_8_21_14_0_10_43_13]|uniref:EamA domain-containing protein n=1 Tax=Candidatus Berkelbacteria bacterium CG10_big_fil_rev_8_21_14_0_10_43_13 TaxID=1974514 RepID=A0A2H0W7B1_9BACT|nr:MAG: hypothetical protein COT78_00600 [Candidatus Berkelbacteria bacterium CG10_big_fil_rev_8_21_14_0_10_43_13]